MRKISKRTVSVVRKCVAVSALVATLGFNSATVMATDITITPVQASFLTKANTVVYLTADLSTPTECILPEDFQVSITGVTNTGFWEIEINGVKFYIVGDAVKTGAVAATPQVQAPVTVTTGMKNAVKKAKSYIKISGFSRKDLISQLEYNGFTEVESIYGADNCGADWNNECLEKAQSYIKISGFSRQDLINQLAYNGFTDSEILYGVDNCGANWDIECAEKAQSYMKISSFSRQGLIDQLTYNGFTPSQIAYGIATVGY